MKIYLVGGAVRDTVMGLVPKDRDYVVVGSSLEKMLALGYQQVGASFPVFLKDGEEYALARTERKTGVGYNGFSTIFDPSITLEEDLIRRDLTINSMAMDLETGEIFDPYGGMHDIAQGVLRHTSQAFSDDPVRVLRTARFAARYQFKIAYDTIQLMHHVVPEIDFVPAERVFAEFQKGLAEDHPYQMMEALDACEAGRAKALNPYMQCWARRTLKSIVPDTPMHVRFALAASSFVAQDYENCKIPTDLARVSKAVHTNFAGLDCFNMISAADAVTVMDKLRAFSDPEHTDRVLDVMCMYNNHIHGAEHAANWTNQTAKRMNAARSIDAAAIAASCTNPREIKDAIFNARVNAVANS